MRTASFEAEHMTAPDQVADLPFFLAPGRSSTHGHRGRRTEPNAGAGTPEVRPHRITRNTGRAQCARTSDPCNKVAYGPFRHRQVLLYGLLHRRPVRPEAHRASSRPCSCRSALPTG